MFNGINLNYLEDTAMGLLVDAIGVQKITKGPVSYEALKALDSQIPEQAYRTYYIKGSGSPRILKVERNNG